MAEELNGLEYLGKCYDLLALDPLNLGGSSKGVNALDVARSGIETYTQGGYTVPVGVSLQSPFKTEVKSSRSLIRNSFDFQNEFSSTLEANAGISGFFEFSASGSYKEISNVSESRQRVFTYVTVYVQNHIVELELGLTDPGRLGSEFKKAVAALPAGYATAAEKQAYGGFVRKFGTHFVKRVSLGGMAYSRVSSVASKVASSKEKEDSFKANASLEIAAFKAGTSASEARRSVQKTDSENELDRTVLVFCGGIGNTHEIADDWFSGLKERPAPIPIGTEMERLSALLSTSLFSDDASIAAKAKALDAGIDEYIIASGGLLDGVIRYGDKITLCHPAGDPAYYPERPAYVYLKNTYPDVAGILTFHNPRIPPDDALDAATMRFVDPEGRWGGPQQSHEVMLGPDSHVLLHLDNQGVQGFLTQRPKRDNFWQVKPAADDKSPSARWMLGLVDCEGAPGPKGARPLVSGDYVVLYRLDQGAKKFFRLFVHQPMPQTDYPLVVQESGNHPMYGGLEDRGGSILVVRKLK